jgi:hypothetical protein
MYHRRNVTVAGRLGFSDIAAMVLRPVILERIAM